MVYSYYFLGTGVEGGSKKDLARAQESILLNAKRKVQMKAVMDFQRELMCEP